LLRKNSVSEAEQTILVVEDEEMIRKFIVEILSTLEYRVLKAANGSEAIQLSSQVRGRIHLLLTDVIMPEISGSDLARRFQQLKQETQTIFVSGL
jgi:YesN/AraC family two-component response regulator